MKDNNSEMQYLNMTEVEKVCGECTDLQAMKAARDKLAGDGCLVFGVVWKDLFPHLVYAAVAKDDLSVDLLALMEALEDYRGGDLHPEDPGLTFEQVRLLTGYGHGFSAYLDEKGLVDLYHLSKDEDTADGRTPKRHVTTGF